MCDLVYGKELTKPVIQTEIDREEYHLCRVLHATSVSNTEPSLKNLMKVVLSKVFLEIIAVQFEMNGIIFALQNNLSMSLLLDTMGVLTAVIAIFVGVENLRFLRTHNLMRRALVLVGAAITISIAVIVWHFGFHI